MPKSLEEIKGFQLGLVSSPSSIDTPNDAATYSLNVEPNLELGTIKGIYSNLLLSSKGFDRPRYSIYRIKLEAHGDGFSVNNYQRQWFHFDTYNQRYWVWFAQDASTTDFIGGAPSRASEYQGAILRDNQEEVRIELTGLTSVADVATKIANTLTVLGPSSTDYLYKEVATTWFNAQAELISTDYYVKFTSNFYGNIPRINFTSNFNNHAGNQDPLRFSNVSIDGDVSGSGIVPCNLEGDFNFKFAKLVDKGEKHSFIGLANNKIYYIDDIYGTSPDIINLDNAIISEPKGYTSAERNKNVYLGTGGNTKWIGDIDRKQIDKEHKGVFIENAKCVEPTKTITSINYDNLVVPLLHSGMNSSNSMIAGAASLYGASANTGNTNACGGADKFVNDSDPGTHRTLNGWVMQSLINAGAAFQSNGLTEADDADNFHWDSVKRGMILRVNIGQEGAATKYVARTNWNSIGVPVAGDAMFELQRIKEIGYGDVSAIDTAAQEGVELHDGDLFQVVTVPSGAASGHDTTGASTGDEITYPRLIYVGSTIGNNNDHDSTNAYHCAPAWAYGINDDGYELHRIALSECNDADITSANVSNTFSTSGATGNTTSDTDFLYRTTTIDLRPFLGESFKIGTIANCVSTDGEGGISGRTGSLATLTIDAVTRSNSVGGTGGTDTDVDAYVKFHTTADHGYIIGDWVTISNSTNHDGTFQIVWKDADEFVLKTGSIDGADDDCNVLGHTRNYYAGHGKLWITSSDEKDFSRLWLVDVVNWHGDDEDNARISVKEFSLNFNRIHSSLISSISGQGLVEEPYWSKKDPNGAITQDIDWVDRSWTNTPKNAFIGGVCETYSHQPHLDDGADTGAGNGRWRVWLAYSKVNQDDTFNRWDLFLYNIRPTEMNSETVGNIYMYDKTPPYQECGQMHINIDATPGGTSYQGDKKPIYFPKDKFQFSQGGAVRQDGGTGGVFNNSYTNYNNDTKKDNSRYAWSQWDATTYSSTANWSEVDTLAACHIAASTEGSSADNFNCQGMGLHQFVKGDESTEIKMGINPNYTDAHSDNNTKVFRDGTEYTGSSIETDFLVQGGPMFKDPSGMWHSLEAPEYGYYQMHGGEYVHTPKGATVSLSLGANIGWLNSDFTDNKHPRKTKVYRHCLIPYHLNWFNTSGTDAVKEYPSDQGTDSKVAHQVNLVTIITGQFVRRGGTLTTAFKKGVQDNQHGAKYPSWQVWEGGEIKTYSDNHMMFQVHDSPCAFTTTSAPDSADSTTGNVLTDWSDTHEIQGRPSNTVGTDDVIANFNTNKGVAPSQGFSGYNQFRWGHGKNGTADIDAGHNGQAAYSSDSLWVTWDSYRGNDGYGHYTNITTTWSSVCDGSYPLILIPGKYNLWNRGRYRNFNSAFWVNAEGASVADAPSGSGGPQQDTAVTNGGVDGSGYFTWYPNSNTHAYNNTSSENTESRVAGHYPSTGGYTMADSVNSTVVPATTANAPEGQKWDNRRIVMCWSILEGDTGWLQQCGSTLTTQFTKNPRCTMHNLNKAYTSYDAGADEKKSWIKIHNIDTIPVKLGSELRNCFIINGLVENDDRTLNMTCVSYGDIVEWYGPSHTGNGSSASRGRNNSTYRPVANTTGGVLYNSKRCYFNEKLYMKNIATASFLAGTDWDLYCPIIVGYNKTNTKSTLSTWRRNLSPGWVTADTSANPVESPGYNFDRFYNKAGSDAAVTPYGLDNAAHTSISDRFPTETLGSKAGTNAADASTTSGTDLTAAGVHYKTEKLDFFDMSLLDADTSEASEFKANDNIEYKISFLYDGFQDSPLSRQSWEYTGTGTGGALDVAYKGMSITFTVPKVDDINLSKRVTHILFWRRNNEFEQFRYVNEIKLDNLKGTRDEEGRHVVRILDKKSFESYNNVTGIAENIKDTSLNYTESAQINDFLFVTDAFHPEVQESENFIFRSKPGKFSVFDWSTDFISMPTKPIALASFGGKLYVFSREKLYRVDPDGLFIENVMEGVGILNKESVVVTDFGMFFCDHNNMYQHDGSIPKAIGGTVLENTDNPEWSIGYKRAIKKALKEGYSTFVQFDGRNKCVYFIIQGYSEGVSDYSNAQSRVFSYSFEKGRYDYYDMPAIKSTASGKDGDCLLLDGYQIWSYRTDINKTKGWCWESKKFDLGSIAQEKVFKSIKLTGSPTATDISGGNNDDIKVFLDGVQQKLTLDNKNYYPTAPIAGFTADQNWGTSADTGSVYNLIGALPGNGEITFGAVNKDSFVLNVDSMPEFVSGSSTAQDNPVMEGDITELKYISPGQYLLMEMTNSSSNRKLKEVVKVSAINLIWASSGLISRVEVECERGQLNTTAIDFNTLLNTDQNWEHASIRYIGLSLKFPTGSKGKTMQIKLKNQKGTIDSIGVIYRGKAVK